LSKRQTVFGPSLTQKEPAIGLTPIEGAASMPSGLRHTKLLKINDLLWWICKIS
jgi:hypothetical protein